MELLDLVTSVEAAELGIGAASVLVLIHVLDRLHGKYTIRVQVEREKPEDVDA